MIHSFKSNYDVQTTMDRVVEFLKSKNVHIMARVDHSQGAKQANLDLRPTQTLIFGSPLLGTHLMLKNQEIAVDLPLKIAVWQDENGQTFLAHPDLDKLIESYGIKDVKPILEKMKQGLDACVAYSIS